MCLDHTMQYHCILISLSLRCDMKVFSSILALYMMVLFMTPCSDTYEKQTVRFQEYSTEITHEHNHDSYNHDHSETKDFCTPFCLCSCCGTVSGIVLQWNTHNFNHVKPFELFKTKEFYKSTFIPRYFGEIWQPPKINA